MLIETTHKYDTKEEAQDSLYGLKSIPGYIFGYVRLPLGPDQPFNVVLIFHCASDNPTLNLSKQRAIENLTLKDGTAIINNLSNNLTSTNEQHQTLCSKLTVISSYLALIDRHHNKPGMHPNLRQFLTEIETAATEASSVLRSIAALGDKPHVF